MTCVWSGGVGGSKSYDYFPVLSGCIMVKMVIHVYDVKGKKHKKGLRDRDHIGR